MPTLTETLELPGSVDPQDVTVVVELWGDGAALHGFDANTIGGKLRTAGASWSIDDIVGNADIIPAGTVYRVERWWPGLRAPLVDFIEMPTTGTTWRVDQLLVDEPATSESAALALHAADTDLHGGGLQLFAAHKSDGLFATTSTAPVPVTGWSGSMTVPARAFVVTAMTSIFTGDANVPGHLAVYARIPVTAAQRVGGVVTLTVPTGHGVLPGVIPLVDLANNSYDLTTDVGVPGNAVTAVTATTVRYSQAGGDLGTSTGFLTFRVGVTASVKGIGQAIAPAVVPNVLWAPAAGLAVTLLPHVRTDNAASSVTVNSGDLGGFGNGPNYAAMEAVTR